MDASSNDEEGHELQQFPSEVPVDHSSDRPRSVGDTMDNTKYQLVDSTHDPVLSTVDPEKNDNGDPFSLEMSGRHLNPHEVKTVPNSMGTKPGNEKDDDTLYNNTGYDNGNGDDDLIAVSPKSQLKSILYLPVIILTPILLLPIIFVVDESYQKEARCGYVISIMAVYWTTEVMPIAITALLPVVLFPMLEVMTARETSSAYFNDTSMLFVGGLLVAIAIEIWDVHRRVALLTVLLVGAEPKSLLLGITLVTWFLSMWISNTATTAMMMTMVQALLDQYKEVYIQRDSHMQHPGHQRHKPEMSKASEREYIRLCKAVSLTVAYAANIGGVGSLTGTGPNLIFYSAAQDLFEAKNLKNPVTFGTWLAYGVPLSLILVLVMWLWMITFFLRCRGDWPCACCKKQKRGGFLDIKMVNAVIRQEYDKMGPVSYAQKTIFVSFIVMIICWITRDLGGAGGWGSLFPPRTVSDSTPSILFGVLMFILPSALPRICGKGGKNGRYIKVRPLLLWKNVHEKMPWTLYLVLGGGYALAKASSTSGLSAWLGEQLLVFKGLNNWLILLIVCYVVALATEVTSNSATATLMMPILSQMAISLQVNPLFFMFPAAIATSFAFMLPAATPPNAIVFSKGVVRVIDMVSCGVALNMVAVPILVMASATWGNALFHFDTIQPEFLGNTTLPGTV